MATIDHLPQLAASLDVRGTVQLFDPATGAPTVRAVLQGATEQNANLRAPGGALLMLRPYVAQRPSQTRAQRALRLTVARQVAAYKLAPADAEYLAAPDALERHCTIYQAYVGLGLRIAPIVIGAEWDAGASLWDARATEWDLTRPSVFDAGLSLWDGGASTWNF